MEETYKVELTWYSNTLDAQNRPVSVPRTEEVELWHLQRTVMAHSKLAMRMLKQHQTDDEWHDLEVDFARTMIVDEKLREEIAKDLFACVDLLEREACQKDIADFFGTAGFLRKTSDQNPQPTE